MTCASSSASTAPAEPDGEHRAVLRVAVEPAEDLVPRCDLSRNQDAAAELGRGALDCLFVPKAEPDAPASALVSRAVLLDDDGKSELARRPGGFLRRAGPPKRCDRHAVPLEGERRLVLRESTVGEEVGEIDRVFLIGVRRRNGMPAGNGGQRAQRVSRPAQECDISPASELSQRRGRICRLDGGDGWKDF